MQYSACTFFRIPVNQRENGTTKAFAASFLVRVDHTDHQPAKAFLSKSLLLSSLTNWFNKIWVHVSTEQLLVAFVSLWNHLGASFPLLLTPLLQPALCHGSQEGSGHILHLKAAKQRNSEWPFLTSQVDGVNQSLSCCGQRSLPVALSHTATTSSHLCSAGQCRLFFP